MAHSASYAAPDQSAPPYEAPNSVLNGLEMECDESSAEWPGNADQHTTPNDAQWQLVSLIHPPQESCVPIFEVAFDKSMWWSMPEDLSMQLYEKFKANENATYTWGHRDYELDFAAMEQRNIANDRRRSLRLIWLSREEVAPSWTGQIPE